MTQKIFYYDVYLSAVFFPSAAEPPFSPLILTEFALGFHLSVLLALMFEP